MFPKLFVNLRKAWPKWKHVVLLNETEFSRVDTDSNFVYELLNDRTGFHTSNKKVDDKGKDTKNTE